MNCAAFNLQLVSAVTWQTENGNQNLIQHISRSSPSVDFLATGTLHLEKGELKKKKKKNR